MLPASSLDVDLSAAELEALRYLSVGLRISEIGELVHFSPDTIKRRLAGARRKLRAKNNAHAIAIALRAGLIH